MKKILNIATIVFTLITMLIVIDYIFLPKIRSIDYERSQPILRNAMATGGLTILLAYVKNKY